MAFIKRGTTPTLSIIIDGITPTDVSKVEFIFKPRRSEEARCIMEKSYPENVSYDANESVWHIPFTDAETRVFTPGCDIFMDTRITLKDGAIPATEITSFKVTETLFEG